jgi:hypothetical protein
MTYGYSGAPLPVSGPTPHASGDDSDIASAQLSKRGGYSWGEVAWDIAEVVSIDHYFDGVLVETIRGLSLEDGFGSCHSTSWPFQT